VPMRAEAAAASGVAGLRPALLVCGDARQRRALQRLLAGEGIAAACRDAVDCAGVAAAEPGTLVFVEDECKALIETLRRQGRAASLVVVQSRVGAAEGGAGEVVLRAPATPRRLRQAIAQCLRPERTQVVPANPWEGLRDEYAGATVLLVEDDATSRRVTLELLTFAGIDVTVAENGRAALDALTGRGARPVQLVLMDVQMPEMDGLTATRMLRAAGIGTPIVALTAGASLQEREDCFAAGMSDWLAKPPDLADLEAVLARWLPARRREAAERSPTTTAAAAPQRQTPASLDEETALQRFLGNRPAFEATLRAFVEDQRPVVGRIGALFAAGENEAAARHLHTLAGSAALLGAEKLHAAARALEQAARAGAGDPQGEGSRRLAEAFEEVARAAQRFLPR